MDKYILLESFVKRYMKLSLTIGRRNSPTLLKY